MASTEQRVAILKRHMVDKGPSKRGEGTGGKTKELEAKLAKKDNVIAEVAAELVAIRRRRPTAH